MPDSDRAFRPSADHARRGSLVEAPQPAAPAPGRRTLVESAEYATRPTELGAAATGAAPAQSASGVTRGASPATLGPSAAAEDARVATTAAAAQLGQQGDAVRYYALHEQAFLAAARFHLVAARLGTGHPQLTWLDRGERFVDQLLFAMTGPEPAELPGLLHPADPWPLIDDQRGAVAHDATRGAETAASSASRLGPMRWNPTAGLVIATAIERAVRSRLSVVSARYVAMGRGTTASMLIASHPMDRVVGEALCATNVVIFHPAGSAPWRGTPSRGAGPSAGQHAGLGAGYDVQANGLRIIEELEWLGAHEPRMWNWLHITKPADPTAEEVAVHLWNDSQYAYGLTVTGSYVALPEAWALRIRDAAVHKPLALPADSLGEQLASSAVADEVALAQATPAQVTPAQPAPAAMHAPGKRPPVAPDREPVLATLESSAAILNELDTLLGPWALDPTLSPARRFVRAKWQQLAAATPDEVARWAPVVTGQRRLLADTAAGAQQALQLLSQARITPETVKLGDRTDPALDVLHSFAQAAGTSQLVDTARTALAHAQAALAQLPVALVVRASAEAGRELGALRQGEAADPTVARGRSAALGPEQAQLAADTDRLQRQVVTGYAPDAAALEAAALEAATLSFRARLGSLQHLLGQFLAGIEAEDRGVMAAIANAFSWEMTLVPIELDAAIDDLQDVDDELGRYAYALVNAKYDAMPPSNAREFARQFELRETRKAQLAIAQLRFAEVTRRRRLESGLFERAQRAIKSAQLRKVAVDIAAMLALAVVSGGVAAVAGEAVSGAVGGARTVTTLAEAADAARAVQLAGRVTSFVVDAAGQAAGQTALHGGQLGASFVEDLVTNAAVLAALHPLQAAVRSWEPLSEEAFNAWTEHGQHLRIGLAKGTIITAELVTSMAVAYATKRVLAAAQGETPDEETVASWAVQGATLALGRMIHLRLEASIERLQLAAHATGDLVARMAKQRVLAARVERQGEAASPHDAMELLIQHHRLLEEEIGFWRRLRDDPASLRQAKLTRAQVDVKLAGAAGQRANTEGQAFRHMPLLLSGLTQEFEGGRLWVGSTEDVAIGLAQAQRAGMTLVVQDHDIAAHTWRVTLDGEELVIRERAREGRVREAKPASEVTAADVAHAQRYAAAARDLRPVLEAQTRAVVEAEPDFATDAVQVGHSFGGVMNQDTQHEAGNPADPHLHLIVYEHDGAMTARGDLRSGQPPDRQTMPGVRTREHTTDQDHYTRSQDLGDATEVGRLEMQTPAYQAKAGSIEERAHPRTTAEPWRHPERALRIRVSNDRGPRWIYTDHVEDLGGMGPANYKSARDIAGEPGASPDAKQQMFDQMRAKGVLVAGDDPDISSQLREGDRVLVWGGSPTGAWAGEDAAMHGARVDVVGEAVNQASAREFQKQLEAAKDDPAKVQQLLEQRIQETHTGSALARNRAPGATYGPDAKQRGIHVEVGVPTQMRLLPSGKVEVTIGIGEAAAGIGDRPTVRVYDRIVVAHGQDPRSPDGLAGRLGPGAATGDGEVPDGTIALHMVLDRDGRLVALESHDGRVVLKGAAGATKAAAPWVIAKERAAFLEKAGAIAAVGEKTHTGETISADSRGVGTGIEAHRDRVPVGGKVLGARDAKLPTAVRADRLSLPPDHPEGWSERLEVFFTGYLRARRGHVRVTLVDTGREGVRAFRVVNDGEEVGIVRIYDHLETAQQEASLRAEVAAAVPTLEPANERGRAAVAGVGAMELSSHAREPNLQRGATIAGMVDEWAMMPEGTAKDLVFTNRVRAAVIRTAQTLAEFHNHYADGGALMTPAAKLRDIETVHARLQSPELLRALGSDQVAEVRARLAPLEAAFMNAKLPATAELGNADASALEFKDYKLDMEATAAAKKLDPKAEIMTFGKMSVADIGDIRTSLDPTTLKGTGTGIADAAEFLESLRRNPRLTPQVNVLEKLFMNEYRDNLTNRTTLDDQNASENWYRILIEADQASRGTPNAAERLRNLVFHRDER